MQSISAALLRGCDATRTYVNPAMHKLSQIRMLPTVRSSVDQLLLYLASFSNESWRKHTDALLSRTNFYRDHKIIIQRLDDMINSPCRDKMGLNGLVPTSYSNVIRVRYGISATVGCKVVYINI